MISEAPISGEIRLCLPEALAFIEKAELHNWAVIGVDGGHIIGGAFEPDSSMILDLSDANGTLTWEKFREQNNSRARAFVTNAPLQSVSEFYITYADRHAFANLRRLGS